MSSKITVSPKIEDVFAVAGDRTEIPLNSTKVGFADLTNGFPKETGLSAEARGVPPQRTDFNGILNLLSQFCYFAQSGGNYIWDSSRDYIPGCEVFGSNGILYRCVEPNGPNYGGVGAKDPISNSSVWGDAGGKPWVNIDSVYQQAVVKATSQATAISSPVGTISVYAGNVEPTGWFFCRGQTYPTSQHPELYALLKDTYGVLLPDLRGVFVRGFDAAGGKDLGRSLGSYQEDAFKAHTHNYTSPLIGTLQGLSKDNSGTAVEYPTENGAISISTGGTETRPKNIALNYIIKY